MQSPLFRRYGVDEATFWAETNASSWRPTAGAATRSRGEISYLNHLLTYVLAGRMAGLNNRRSCRTGAARRSVSTRAFPDSFEASKACGARTSRSTASTTSALEHYIVSTGLAEMIRGSAIAPYVDGIWGCEFIENPLPARFPRSRRSSSSPPQAEIAQIGMMIDNTTKTRAIFEINKGTNKNPALDVNARIAPEDRRIPFQNMIYIADGPSDMCRASRS
jgi:hypothetical protein